MEQAKTNDNPDSDNFILKEEVNDPARNLICAKESSRFISSIL